MRPFYGVALESLVLAAVLTLVITSRLGGLLDAVVLLVAQAVTTFLVHCPAHYVVGSILGIRFRSMKIGRTTLVRAVPGPLKPLGRLLLVASLSVAEESRRSVTGQRLKAMYLAGVLASAGSSLVYAAAVTRLGNLPATALTWLFAVSYLLSDVVASPKAGDVMRARAAEKSEG